MQMAFAGHLRDPDAVAPPDGIEDRRMEIYRGLFFRNIRSFMSGAYPVLKSLYEDSDWDQLIREFFIEHRCQTPMFPELSREFLRYLQETRGERDGDFPFMLELAHYEWVERGVRIEATEIDSVDADPNGDLLEDIPVLSPLAWPLSYQYPVHRICDTYIPTEPPEEPTHLLVYRRRNDKVKFMQINAVSRMLLDQIQENLESDSMISGREILRNIARSIGRPGPDDLIAVGQQLLTQWRERDILLGTRKTQETS